MTRLVWGDRHPAYDLGLDQGVLYLDDVAVPWNGLVSVNEKETGSVDVDHYFDGNRTHISQVTGDFGAQVSAYTYPDVFAEYNGYSEREIHKRFGLSYRTQHGLDGYKIHLVYNVLVSDDERTWSSANESIQPSLFNWDISGASVPIPGASPSSRVTLEAHRDATVLKILEDILYGTDASPARLPYPEELVEIYESASLLRVSYSADGRYTIEGPDDMVTIMPNGVFQINAPTLTLLDADRFIVHSF